MVRISKTKKKVKRWCKLAPWLTSSGDTHLGCSICALGVSMSPNVDAASCPWASGRIETATCQLGRLYKHEASKKHRSFAELIKNHHNIASGPGACSGPSVAEHLAPSICKFMAVLESLRSAGATCMTGIGSLKIRKMLQCLAEAKREYVRQSLIEAESISVTQDVRSPQLLVRYTACNADLNRTSSVLGQCDLSADGFDHSAVGVYMGTMYIVCKLDMRPNGSSPSDVLDAAMNKTEMFAADAAYDEQLAGTRIHFAMMYSSSAVSFVCASCVYATLRVDRGK